jgi:hypothetical protein
VDLRGRRSGLDRQAPNNSPDLFRRFSAAGPIDEKRFGKMGTKPASGNSLAECSNLARGESMKDPVHIFGCGRGFHMEVSDGRSATPLNRGTAKRAGRAMRSGVV